MVMDDDEPENGEQSELPDKDMVADALAKPVASWTMLERIAEHEKSRMLADSTRGRVSVKGKLAEMSARLGKDKAGVQKADMAKNKGKEESL